MYAFVMPKRKVREILKMPVLKEKCSVLYVLPVQGKAAQVVG
jgi:hypothetical protein